MAISPWLWLEEAVTLIANHLAKENSDRYRTRRRAVEASRNQILDQAHRGALKIEGKVDDPLEENPRIVRSDWKVVPASIWSPNFKRRRQIFSPINRIIVWKTNCVSYEEEGICFGFFELRLRRTELENIWSLKPIEEPPVERKEKNVKNSGGRPSEYTHVLVSEIEKLAGSPTGLPQERGGLFRKLRDFRLPHWAPGAPEDGTIRYAIRVYRQKLGS